MASLWYHLTLFSNSSCFLQMNFLVSEVLYTLKLFEDLKELSIVWVVSVNFTVLEIKAEKFKKHLLVRTIMNLLLSQKICLKKCIFQNKSGIAFHFCTSLMSALTEDRSSYLFLYTLPCDITHQVVYG